MNEEDTVSDDWTYDGPAAHCDDNSSAKDLQQIWRIGVYDSLPQYRPQDLRERFSLRGQYRGWGEGRSGMRRKHLKIS